MGRVLRAAVVAAIALLVSAAVAVAAPKAGKWEGTTSQGRVFSFKVSDKGLVHDIRFRTKVDCTSKTDQKWSGVVETKSYKSTKEKVKGGEIDIVRHLDEQDYELHGTFNKGKATGTLSWKYFLKSDGKSYAYKKSKRHWTCKTSFGWSVTKPA